MYFVVLLWSGSKTQFDRWKKYKLVDFVMECIKNKFDRMLEI